VKTIFGILLVLAGFILAGIEFLAVLDPEGTKMADDGDPFGPVAPWWQHALWFMAIAACFAVAWRLLRRSS